MQSIIIHKLKYDDGKWEIKVAPRIGKMIRHRFMDSLPLNRYSEPVTAELVLNYLYNSRNPRLDYDAINQSLSHARVNVPQGLRVIATLPGGFWYRFSHHDEKMSTYIKINQYIVILEGEDTVFTAIGYVGETIDYSVLQGCHSGMGEARDASISQLIIGHGERRNAIEELKSLTKGAKKVSIIDPYLLGAFTGKCEVNEQFFTLAKRSISNKAVLELLEKMVGKTYGSMDKLFGYVKNSVSVREKDLQAITKVAERLFLKQSYVPDLMKAVSAKDISELNIFYSKKHSDNAKVREQIKSCFSGKLRFCDLDTHDELFVHDRLWVVDSSRAVVVGNSFGGLGMNAISFILDLPAKDLAAFKAEMKVTGIDI